jgi:lipoprotein-anchoring transpeptidase ErfK/SrfK
MIPTIRSLALAALAACAAAGAADAQSYAPAAPYPDQVFAPMLRDDPVNGERLRRQVVEYATREAPGTIVIDTPNTYLYLVLGHDKAIRYGIGVGREGFTWAGHEKITRKAEWPDWNPPTEMIERQPYLPRFMAGGPSNPLGARAMYLGGTVYRIHGTNQPSTIGSFVSSGCIRLVNEDVEDLYSRVKVGTKVVVLPQLARAPAANATAVPSRTSATSAPTMTR